MHIEIFKTDGRYGWTVICDGKFQSNLSQDEALWVVANALQGNIHGYLRTYEDWLKQAQRFGMHTKDPVGMIEQ